MALRKEIYLTMNDNNTRVRHSQAITRRDAARDLSPEEKLLPIDQGIIEEALDRIFSNNEIREYIGEEDVDGYRAALMEDASIGHKRVLDVVRWHNNRFPNTPVLIPSDKFLGRGLSDMHDHPLHKSEVIIGDERNTMLAKGARVAMLGQPKSTKTCLAIQMSLDLASGGTFLGRYPVSNPNNVLYLNFELDEALFEERIMLVKNALSYQDTPRFKQLTLLGNDIPLLDTKKGHDQLKAILDMHKSSGFPVEVLVLDCRWKTFLKSDNEGEVMRTWLSNVESLQIQFGFVPVIIHHEGKKTTGMGSGSSNFDRWINTAIHIQAQPGEATRNIRVYGNYTGVIDIAARLEYPIHKVSANVEAYLNRPDKKQEAVDFILSKITEKGGQIEQQELVQLATDNGITSHTFNRALNELDEQQRINKVQDTTKPGRHNIIKIVAAEDQAHP